MRETMANGQKGLVSQFAGQFGKAASSVYVPGFLFIHLRYLRYHTQSWLALFVAPFVATKAVLGRLSNWSGDARFQSLSFDLIALAVIAACFMLAERRREFRRYYVYAVPIIIFVGLVIGAAAKHGWFTRPFWPEFLMVGFLAYIVGRVSIGKGYQALKDGGDMNYRKGRAYFDERKFKKAMPLLEKSAKGGHFKALYLIAEAYQKGLGDYPQDKVRAAEYYARSGRKGYRRATQTYRSLLDTLSPDEMDAHRATPFYHEGW